jgi:hypothetical protein
LSFSSSRDARNCGRFGDANLTPYAKQLAAAIDTQPEPAAQERHCLLTARPKRSQNSMRRLPAEQTCSLSTLASDWVSVSPVRGRLEADLCIKAGADESTIEQMDHCRALSG